jgi:hypothetical protein
MKMILIMKIESNQLLIDSTFSQTKYEENVVSEKRHTGAYEARRERKI